LVICGYYNFINFHEVNTLSNRAISCNRLLSQWDCPTNFLVVTKQNCRRVSVNNSLLMICRLFDRSHKLILQTKKNSIKILKLYSGEWICNSFHIGMSTIISCICHPLYDNIINIMEWNGNKPINSVSIPSSCVWFLQQDKLKRTCINLISLWHYRFKHWIENKTNLVIMHCNFSKLDDLNKYWCRLTTVSLRIRNVWLRDKSWKPECVLSFNMRWRIQFTNILPNHVKTQNTFWLPWIISILICLTVHINFRYVDYFQWI